MSNVKPNTKRIASSVQGVQQQVNHSVIPASTQGKLWLLWLVIVLPLWLLGWISEELLEHEHFAFDVPIMQAIHVYATPWLDHVAIGLSLVGGLPVMSGISVVLAALVWRYDRIDSHLIWISMLGAALMTWVMKLAFDRPRPMLWPRLVQEYGASFPSGHSLYAMVFGVLMLILSRHVTPQMRLAVMGLAVLWIVLVGLSRVYLGVHYPTDVLGGWAVGWAWVCGVWLLLRKIHHNKAPMPSSTPSFK
jgi:membrane-associated phospholipid phosphatase